MSSTMRRTGFRSSVERPMVGDTKTSMVREDHLGWLKCDGRLLLKSEYVTLYAVLGDSFGVSGEYFFLPDAMGRVMGLIGQSDVTTWEDGDVSGEETHTLTIAEMPAHNHDICGGQLNTDNNVDPDMSGNTSYSSTGITVNSVGDHTHNYTTYIDSDRGYVAAEENDGVLARTQTLATSLAGGHSHTINDPTHRHQIASNGGSLPHNNMQPTLFLGNLFIFSGRPTFGAFDTVGSAGPSYFPPRNSVRLF